MMRFFSWTMLVFFLAAMAPKTYGQVDPAKGQILVDGVPVGTLQQAFDAVKAGGTIRIGPGTYKMAGVLRSKNRRGKGEDQGAGKDGVSIFGSPGTIFDGVAVERKATFVLSANDITMEDIICRNAKVKDRNGACVRFEGTNLTLRRVTFENSENGILANKQSGDILIEDSMFRANGAAGRAHGIYVSGGRLTVRRTQVLSSKDQGHGIKSRAERTIIEDSVIASLEGDDSRLIDLPNGGVVAIRNCLLVEGANTVNWQLLSYGVENNLLTNNLFRMENNLIITDRDGGSELILVGDSMPRPIIQRNLVVGRITYDWPDNNYFYENRRELELPPAGELPEWAALTPK